MSVINPKTQAKKDPTYLNSGHKGSVGNKKIVRNLQETKIKIDELVIGKYLQKGMINGLLQFYP